MTVPFVRPSHWQPRPSPNHSARRAQVSAIVLHADASGRADSALDWIRRPENKVSYHILIDRDGTVYEVVNPDRRAWHAGVSKFEGKPDVNQFSVGVCLSNRNDGVEPYPVAQLAAAVQVCVQLARHYNIPTSRITTHAVIAPDRKTDPRGLHLNEFRAQVAKALGRTTE